MTPGMIPAYRTSSAHARGKAGRYPYWGTAAYQVFQTAGEWRSKVIRGARSDRRSLRLAVADTALAAENADGIVIHSIGRLSAVEIARVEAWLERHP